MARTIALSALRTASSATSKPTVRKSDAWNTCLLCPTHLDTTRIKSYAWLGASYRRARKAHGTRSGPVSHQHGCPHAGHASPNAEKVRAAGPGAAEPNHRQ